MLTKTYSELIKLPTFKERFEYLRCNGTVGKETFTHSYIRQQFYLSELWNNIRKRIIVRDNGCDLGIAGREIFSRPTIHHINPVTLYDLKNVTDLATNPENLILTSYDTHNAIHYGNTDTIFVELNERKPNDTCPWKK